MSFPLSLDTAPMEARTAATLPTEDGPWIYEPKWDGFRCLVFKNGHDVDLRAKSGKPLGRYFPEVVALVASLPVPQVVVDGEVVVAIDGRLDFDALQMRLHPAESRIRKLSGETPAKMMLFDMLASPEGELLLERPLAERREALERFTEAVGLPDRLELSPITRDLEEAQRWLSQAGGATDGVVAKQWLSPYTPGERSMIKVKRLRTADCVVGGFRYATEGDLVGSLLLGLYDDQGLLDHVGFTSGFGQEGRLALTRRLEALQEPPGFTGKAPGGPSRWAGERSTQWVPLRPELVVEVRFDQITARSFRHGTKLMRWRPDKAPRQCTFTQMVP